MTMRLLLLRMFDCCLRDTHTHRYSQILADTRRYAHSTVHFSLKKPLMGNIVDIAEKVPVGAGRERVEDDSVRFAANGRIGFPTRILYRGERAPHILQALGLAAVLLHKCVDS